MRDMLDTMTLEAIMTRWPETVRVFVDWRLHCIGCPIADFHRLADSSKEHGHAPDALKQAVRLAIEKTSVNSLVPPVGRRRSAAGDAGP